jgi:carboxylesterase type B
LYCPEFGVAHADDLFMLFKAHGFPLETVYTDEDKATSQNMLKLWTNFAKTGNPTPDLELGIVWEKYDKLFFTRSTIRTLYCGCSFAL